MKRMPPSRCLNCRKVCDAATGINAKKPKPGDITICLYCGHVMAFDNHRRLRPLTDDEMHAVAGDKLILKVQAARLQTFGQRK
jgi:hypothetical protein